MQSFIHRSLLGLGASAFIVGCGGQTSNHLESQKVTEPQIGEAFDAYTDEYLNTSCISVDQENVIVVPPRVGQVFYKQDSGFEELSDMMSGGGKLKLELEAVKANGSIDFINKNKASTYSTTYVLAVDQTAGYVSIDFQNPPTMNKNGQQTTGEIGNETAEQKRKRCGTNFVSGKSITANLVAVMKFEFANESDKDEFQGQMKIDLESFGGEAQLEKALEKVTEKASVSLSVHQIGGDATELPLVLGTDNKERLEREKLLKAEAAEKGRVLNQLENSRVELNAQLKEKPDDQGIKDRISELEQKISNAEKDYNDAKDAAAAAALSTGYDIVDCSIKNKGACLSAWRNVVEYATVYFPKQFEDSSGNLDPNKFVAVGYDYSPYTLVEPEWNGKAPSKEMLRQIQSSREVLGLRYLEEQSTLQRAKLLLDSGLVSDVNVRNEILDIADIIDNRMRAIAETYDACYNVQENANPCQDAVSKAKKDLTEETAEVRGETVKMSYDPTKLVVIPTDFIDWCEKLKSWFDLRNDRGYAYANTVLGPETRHTVTKIINTLEGKELNLKHPDNRTDAEVDLFTPDNMSCEKLAENARVMLSIDLTGQFITNIEPIASLPHLETVKLDNNYIADSLPLAKLKHLHTASLNQARVENLTGISISKIRHLDISNNGLIADEIIWSLSGAQYLKTLFLQNNEDLDSLVGLENLPRLKTISTSGSPVDSTEVPALLSKFPKLETFYFGSEFCPSVDDLKVSCRDGSFEI